MVQSLACMRRDPAAGCVSGDAAGRRVRCRTRQNIARMRSGEMAALDEVPFRLDYGSVDATLLFVMLACLLSNAWVTK